MFLAIIASPRKDSFKPLIDLNCDKGNLLLGLQPVISRMDTHNARPTYEIKIFNKLLFRIVNIIFYKRNIQINNLLRIGIIRKRTKVIFDKYLRQLTLQLFTIRLNNFLKLVLE